MMGAVLAFWVTKMLELLTVAVSGAAVILPVALLVMEPEAVRL